MRHIHKVSRRPAYAVQAQGPLDVAIGGVLGLILWSERVKTDKASTVGPIE